MCKLTLPLEVGKKYVRADGRTARIITTDRRASDGSTVVALVEGAAEEYAAVYKPDGSHIVREAVLVSDYVEPIKDRYILVTSTGCILSAGSDWDADKLMRMYPDYLKAGARIVRVSEVR